MKKLGLYLLVAIFCFACTKLNYEEYTVLVRIMRNTRFWM